MWENDGPQTVFIVKKTGSAKTTAKLKEIATWQVMLQLCSLSGSSVPDLTAHGKGANVEQYANSSGYRRRGSESW